MQPKPRTSPTVTVSLTVKRDHDSTVQVTMGEGAYVDLEELIAKAIAATIASSQDHRFPLYMVVLEYAHLQNGCQGEPLDHLLARIAQVYDLWDGAADINDAVQVTVDLGKLREERDQENHQYERTDQYITKEFESWGWKVIPVPADESSGSES